MPLRPFLVDKMVIIKNGEIFCRDGSIKRGSLYIEGGRIVKVCIQNTMACTENYDTGRAGVKQRRPECAEILDASGMYVIPGLIDIHIHGCMGADVCDATGKALDVIAEHELKCGITTFCPTSMSYDEESLKKIFANVSGYVKENKAGDKRARIAGINMEGPFLNPKRCGAQNAKYLCSPDVNMFERLQEAAGGLIKLCDIAPEMPGAMEFMEELKERVHISIAHSQADYSQALEAFKRGADHVTHLFNGMPEALHREPGIVGACADTEGIYAELIGDGVHVHPAMVRAAFKLLGEDRIVLISDSIRACGLPEGEYELGGQRVIVKDKVCRLDDGTIAGSQTDLMDCLREVTDNMGIPFGMAVKCATVNPAKAIGIFEDYGSLDEGKTADIVCLDKNLNIRYVFKDGIRI